MTDPVKASGSSDPVRLPDSSIDSAVLHSIFKYEPPSLWERICRVAKDALVEVGIMQSLEDELRDKTPDFRPISPESPPGTPLVTPPSPPIGQVELPSRNRSEGKSDSGAQTTSSLGEKKD